MTECQETFHKAHTIDHQRELKFDLEILPRPVNRLFYIGNVTLCVDLLMCGIMPIPICVFRHIKFHTLSVLNPFLAITT